MREGNRGRQRSASVAVWRMDVEALVPLASLMATLYEWYEQDASARDECALIDSPAYLIFTLLSLTARHREKASLVGAFSFSKLI